jgi:hypothetical protein
MLRDFGLVTLIDLSVSLLGVLVALPAALVFAERRVERRAGAWVEVRAGDGVELGSGVEAGAGHGR